MGKKKKKAPNGSWRLSWETFETMPDLPFLIGVSVENPPQLSLTLSKYSNIRADYLYPNKAKRIINVGDWILYINGWIHVTGMNVDPSPKVCYNILNN